MPQTFPWAPGQAFPVPTAQGGITAANLEFLGRQAEQTFDAIMHRVADCSPENATMAAEVRARLDECRQGIASLLQCAVALQQLDTPTLRSQALAERGALDSARAAARAEVVRHCMALASTTSILLQILDGHGGSTGMPGAARGGGGSVPCVDMLAPTVLLGGSSAMSFMLSIAANVPVDVPYLQWFSRSTEAMLAVMSWDAEALAGQHGEGCLRHCLPHARALSKCCSELRRACAATAGCRPTSE